MPKVFFDTHILAYGIDKHDSRKQDIALMLLEHAGLQQQGCISTQVLQEFFVVATRKLQLDPLKAKAIIQNFSNWQIAVITPDDIERAIDGQILWQLSFWDALIITAAIKLKCTQLFTEDLNHGQTIGGVQITNPFI
jgi:predicted nucleic acid-binding protein